MTTPQLLRPSPDVLRWPETLWLGRVKADWVRRHGRTGPAPQVVAVRVDRDRGDAWLLEVALADGTAVVLDVETGQVLT